MARRCRSCQTIAEPYKRKCQACGKKLPPPPKRREKHFAALDLPYSVYLAANLGVERCGICGRPPGIKKLHRDHEHKGEGKVRGLLCHQCNRRLRGWMTPWWMRQALDYLERTA